MRDDIVRSKASGLRIRVLEGAARCIGRRYAEGDDRKNPRPIPKYNGPRLVLAPSCAAGCGAEPVGSTILSKTAERWVAFPAKRGPRWKGSLGTCWSRFARGLISPSTVAWSAALRPILAVVVAAEPPSPRSLRRLEHEYALAQDLDPAWAARPLALTRHQGRVALILADPGGEPLDRVIEQGDGRPIAVSRFLQIAIGMAGALGQAHQRGLVHKDIRPANVFVDDAGGVWLTGFGIASRLPRERLAPAPPETIAGTLAYMAPEQTGRMNRSIDSRSDLYSLGVTLYEMLTGTLPFTASDPMEWVHCHIARTPVAPRERLEPSPSRSPNWS